MSQYFFIYEGLEEKTLILSPGIQIVQACELEGSGLGLTEKGEVYKFSPFSRISIDAEVLQIACNKTVALARTSLGLVFSMGQDPAKTGILGQKCFSSDSFQQLVELRSILNISIGKTHAAALSDSDQFYLWGTCSNINSSQTPLKHSFDLFSIEQFECGNNYTLITTPGGYLYIIGKLGYTHAPPAICTSGVVSPPGVEKMCVICSKAASKFVVFVNDNNEVFAFDGCLEIIKLPLNSYHKVKYVQNVGKSIVGVCEDKKIVEWKMGNKNERGCRVYSFGGVDFRLNGSFEVVGGGKKKLFIKSDVQDPIKEKADVLNPYKRTEFGQRLIEKARSSVRVSVGKMDLLRSSIENSPTYREYRSSDLPKCEKVVYAINLIIRRVFADIRFNYHARVFCTLFKNRGMFGMMNNYLFKCRLKDLNKGFEAMKSNVEISIMHESIKKIATEVFTSNFSRFWMYRGFKVMKDHRAEISLTKLFSILQRIHREFQWKFLKSVRFDMKLGKLMELMHRNYRYNAIAGLKRINFACRSEKSCKSLVRLIKHQWKNKMLGYFEKLKDVSNRAFVHQNVYNIHKESHVRILCFSLKQKFLRTQLEVFSIIRHIFTSQHLISLLRRRFRKLIFIISPKIISPTVLKLQSLLQSSSLRVKNQYIKDLLRFPFTDISIHADIDFLSPIKALPQEDPTIPGHIRNNTTELKPVPHRARHKSTSSESLDFKKYLMWWKEFKCKPAVKAKENGEKKPPWKPSGVSVKINNTDEIMKKKYQRRRDYSESIRSSRSSFSSEDEFCKKIGWDKAEYIRKIREKKNRSLNMMIAAKGIGRYVGKKIGKAWNAIKEEAFRSRSIVVKQLVSKSWKIGLFNIGIVKLANFMKKKALKIIIQ